MIGGTCSNKTGKSYVHISGDIEDEDEVLSWLTDENTLEIPGKIEEVNSRMLDKILEENDHVVVFFCEYKFYIWFRNILYLLWLRNTFFYCILTGKKLFSYGLTLIWHNPAH